MGTVKNWTIEYENSINDFFFESSSKTRCTRDLLGLHFNVGDDFKFLSLKKGNMWRGRLGIWFPSFVKNYTGRSTYDVNVSVESPTPKLLTKQGNGLWMEKKCVPIKNGMCFNVLILDLLYGSDDKGMDHHLLILFFTFF